MKNKCPYFEANCGNCTVACAKYLAYEEVKKPGVVEKTIEELGINPDLSTWDLMMAMQLKFAAKFHKVEDLTKDEMDHWIDRYLVCVEDEIREVREHLNIYPDQMEIKTNKIELEKEFIDIIHFVMDEFISGGAGADDIKRAYAEKYNVDVMGDLLEFTYNKQESEVKELYKDYSMDQTILLLVNKLLDCSGKIRQQISWKHWKKSNDTINFNKLYDAFAERFKILVDIYCIMDMTPLRLREIYVNKNIENEWRQRKGY